MKYDVTKILKAFDGKAIVIRDSAEARDMTLRDAIKTACLNAGPEQAKTAEEKIKLYEILSKVHDAEAVVDITAEEVTQLKKVGGALFTVAMVGPFFKALETPGA